ncbi:MAG: LysE family transporter, partial [Promethearchaeia archaeon]
MLEIFIFSFLVALTGALSPGPVLTFTIYKSLKSKKGYLAGLFISLGHASLEFGLILALLFGAAIFFRNLLVITIIGVVGGICLVIFGVVTIRDILKNPIDLNFQSVDDEVMDEEDIKGFQGNSFLGGIITSLSNPYWILWWVVIGLSLMINFGLVDFSNPWGLVAFYLGHELGDLIWFWPISIFVYFGGKSINSKIYKIILIGCGLFMIGFGIYLAVRILLFPP